MPWVETCAMEERIKFICDSESSESSIAELCRYYGISRPTAYKWLNRYREEGIDGLKERSRAPQHHANAVAIPTEQMILNVRQQHPHWGARKIRARLEREFPQQRWPAASTIGELLERNGLIVPRPRRRRCTPTAPPLRTGQYPNAVWCADFKGWFCTQDGRRCDPLTLLDQCSRYLLRCQLLRRTTGGAVRALCEAAFREYGLPEVIRTDNGAPFASRGIGGLSRLSVWWLKLGIRPERIQPGQPQQNGAQERFHRTLKEETATPPAVSWNAQQRRLDRFRQEYNCERPHQALAQQTPESRYALSWRPYPERLRTVQYRSGLPVRRVQKHGEFRWQHENVFLGQAFSGEPIGLEAITERYYRIYFTDYPLGLFDSFRYRILTPAQERRLWRRAEADRNFFRSAPEISIGFSTKHKNV